MVFLFLPNIFSMQLFVYRTLHHVCIARPYYKILWYFFGICYKCNNNHSTKNKKLFVAWLGNKTGKKKQELFNIFWSIRHAIDVFFVLFGLLPSQTSCMSVRPSVQLYVRLVDCLSTSAAATANGVAV